MTNTHKGQEQVYAVVRWDGDSGSKAAPELLVTVKEIVRTLELAEAEVERLNVLNEDKGVRYWCQATRLFPEGRSAGTDVN